MKKIWLGTALELLALLGARPVSAQLALSVVQCQDAILDWADKYVVALHKQIKASVHQNLLGMNSAPDGGRSICVGGTRATKPCVGNGGVCGSGVHSGKPCDLPGDCPGFCVGTPNTLCVADATCGGAKGSCKKLGTCNAIVGCPGGGRCEVLQTKIATIAGNLAKAEKDLRKSITGKCIDPTAFTSLGFPNDQCKGECAVSFSECVTDADCSVNVCTFNINRLMDCIQHDQLGDFAHAHLGNAMSSPLTKVLSTAQPRGAKSNKNPRRRSTVSLPGLFQIGAKSTSSGAGSVGGSSPVGLARCQNSGANNGLPCIEDTDCKSDQTGTTPVCVSDCCDCTGVGVCTVANGVSSLAQGLCTASGQTVCDARGNIVPPGNYLSMPTEAKSNGIETCTVTPLGRVSFATPGLEAGTAATDKGHCFGPDNVNQLTNALCNTGADCAANGPCKGGLTSFGQINLTTAAENTVAPIFSDAWLSAGTSNACPHCISGICDSGPSVGIACAEEDGHTSNACLPGAPAWIRLPGIANVFYLTSGTAKFQGSGEIFCGSCAADASIGCSSDGTQACPSGTGPCIPGTFSGFQGDTAYDDLPAAGAQLSNIGIPNNYGGTGGGVFCTGKSNGIIDGSIGLPGPVRVRQPYLVNWTFSTK